MHVFNLTIDSACLLTLFISSFRSDCNDLMSSSSLALFYAFLVFHSHSNINGIVSIMSPLHLKLKPQLILTNIFDYVAKNMPVAFYVNYTSLFRSFFISTLRKVKTSALCFHVPSLFYQANQTYSKQDRSRSRCTGI